MTFRTRLFTLLLVSMTVYATAFGQSATTATIRGKVTNDAGNAVANAEINAVDTSSGFVKTVHSRADGSYALEGLRPGTYNIVVAAPGLEPKSQDVTVLIGQNLEMNLGLSATAVLKESITVVGNQAVETRTSEIATNVTTHQIENLPQDDRNFLNFAALAPGVRLSKDPLRKTFAGDASNAEQTNIFIDGVSTKNDILLGGSAGQDTSRGNPFPQSAVQEFRVITQNYSAEYDHASSAIITAVTKSGGNQFNGQAFVYYQPKRWVTATKQNFQFSTLSTNASYHRTQPGISLGGPIIKDRVNFFAAYEGDDEHATTPVTLGVTNVPAFVSQFSGALGTFASPFKSTLGFGKLSWQAASNQIVDFSANYRKEHEIRDFGSARSVDAADAIRNTVYGGTVRHQWNNSSSLNEASLSLQKYRWEQAPVNPGDVGLLYFAPGFATILRTGGGDTTQDFKQRRIELRDGFLFAPLTMHGTHNFKVGGNFDSMHYDVNKSLFGNPLFKFLPDDNGNFGNIPFEAQFGIGNPILGLSNSEYGFYGQDNWAFNNNLTLNLGLRWDYESHMLDENYVTPANIVSALKGKTFTFEGRSITIPNEYFSTGTERKPYKDEWQPRFGFSYDLFGNSKSVVFGGWGKYYDRIYLNATLDERFRQQFPVYTFKFSPTGDPANGVLKWDPAFFSVAGMQALVASGQTRPEVYLLNNNTKPPYSTQWNVGYRQAIGSWVGSLSWNSVRGKRLLTWVAASGFDFGALGGLGFELLSDPVGRSTWYDAQSLVLDRPYTQQTHWGAHFVYTHAKTEQNGNDLFVFDLPSASLIARHPVEGSEPNSFVASGIFGLPWDMRFSTNVTLSTGGAKPIQDFSKGFDLAGRLATGVWNGAVYPPKSGGFGYRNVDFRLQKDFGPLVGTTVTAIAEVFNAFNYTNYGCLSNFRAPDTNVATLGIPSCVVSLGRREQIGLKVNF